MGSQTVGPGGVTNCGVTNCGSRACHKLWVQSVSQTESRGCHKLWVHLTLPQAAPNPLLLSRKQSPSPSKSLGWCFWGVSEPPPSRNQRGRGAGGRGHPSSPQKHIYSKGSKRGLKSVRALPAHVASFCSRANCLSSTMSQHKSAEQSSGRISSVTMGSPSWDTGAGPCCSSASPWEVLEKLCGVPSPGTLRETQLSQRSGLRNGTMLHESRDNGTSCPCLIWLKQEQFWLSQH